jgi:hypothetical protein
MGQNTLALVVRGHQNPDKSRPIFSTVNTLGMRKKRMKDGQLSTTIIAGSRKIKAGHGKPVDSL